MTKALFKDVNGNLLATATYTHDALEQFISVMGRNGTSFKPVDPRLDTIDIILPTVSAAVVSGTKPPLPQSIRIPDATGYVSCPDSANSQCGISNPFTILIDLVADDWLMASGYKYFCQKGAGVNTDYAVAKNGDWSRMFRGGQNGDLSGWTAAIGVANGDRLRLRFDFSGAGYTVYYCKDFSKILDVPGLTWTQIGTKAASFVLGTNTAALWLMNASVGSAAILGNLIEFILQDQTFVKKCWFEASKCVAPKTGYTDVYGNAWSLVGSAAVQAAG